jgi:hypothetical protein
MSRIIKNLINKGHSVAIQNGRLEIISSNGAIVPQDWFNNNSHKIALEVAQLVNQSIYVYSLYQTGTYYKGIAPGVMISLNDLLTGENVYAIFNAELKRKRNTKSGNAGAALPKGKFTVGRQSALYKLWLKTDLELPRRPSELYKSMGKLKSIYLTAQISNKSKLSNRSIEMFSCDSQTIHRLIGGNLVASQWQLGGKVVASNGGTELGQTQVASNGVNDIAASQADRALQANSKYESDKLRVIKSKGNGSTCDLNYDQSYKVMTNNVSIISSNKKKIPQEQTHEEWLKDFDSASGGNLQKIKIL